MRFGRTAAVHVIEQVQQRLEAKRRPGFEGQVRGYALAGGDRRATAAALLSRLSGAVPGMQPLQGGLSMGPAAAEAATGDEPLGARATAARAALVEWAIQANG